MPLRNPFRRKAKTEHLAPNAPKLHPIKQIWTTSKGIRYYTFEDVSMLPVARWEWLQSAKRSLELAITPETLKQYADDAAAAYNKGDHLAVATILQELKTRSELKVEWTSLVQMMGAFIIREGENVEEPSQAIHELKVKEWRECPKTYAFFLTLASNTIESLQGLSTATIQHYLTDSETVLAGLKRKLNTDLPPPSTVSKPQQSSSTPSFSSSPKE